MYVLYFGPDVLVRVPPMEFRGASCDAKGIAKGIALKVININNGNYHFGHHVVNASWKAH